MTWVGSRIAQMALAALAWSLIVADVHAGRRVDPMFRSGIEASACANGLIEDAEQCDGANLGGASCASIGLVAGTLACGGTCRFDVSACIANLPPSAVDDSAAFNEDAPPVQFSMAMLTANDGDPDGDPLALVGVSNPTHGSVSMQPPGAVFSVDPNFNGTAGFDYTISDGELADTAHVSLTVVAVNDPPFAVPASETTNQDMTVVITLTGNDIENTPLTFALASLPAHGQMGPVTPTGPTSATVAYTPNAGYFGSDGFTFRAHDGEAPSAAATVALTVVQVACGDGLIRGAEECDDFNLVNGDGCSAMCLIESGFVCSSEPSVCVPL